NMAERGANVTWLTWKSLRQSYGRAWPTRDAPGTGRARSFRPALFIRSPYPVAALFRLAVLSHAGPVHGQGPIAVPDGIGFCCLRVAVATGVVSSGASVLLRRRTKLRHSAERRGRRMPDLLRSRMPDLLPMARLHSARIGEGVTGAGGWRGRLGQMRSTCPARKHPPPPGPFHATHHHRPAHP